MTEQEFKQKTGRWPKDDDLDRVNCDKVGQIGHTCCGWCFKHDGPMFQCMCSVRARAIG